MSNFVENVKMCGPLYAIRTEKRDREFERNYKKAMKRFQNESQTSSSEEDRIIAEINLKLSEAQALAASTSGHIDVERIRELISDILDLIRELDNKTEKIREFIKFVMTVLEGLKKII